jgi:hypothetical protein
MQAFNLDKLAPFKLLQDLVWWIGIQMLLKLAQLSLPLTPLFVIHAANFERVERSSQSLIFKRIEILGLAARARGMVGLDFLDTRFTEAVATAGGLVGLSKNR